MVTLVTIDTYCGCFVQWRECVVTLLLIVDISCCGCFVQWREGVVTVLLTVVHLCTPSRVVVVALYSGGREWRYC